MKSFLVLIAAGIYNFLMDMNLLLCLAVIAGLNIKTMPFLEFQPNIKTMPFLEFQESCLYNFLFHCLNFIFSHSHNFHLKPPLHYKNERLLCGRHVLNM